MKYNVVRFSEHAKTTLYETLYEVKKCIFITRGLGRKVYLQTEAKWIIFLIL